MSTKEIKGASGSSDWPLSERTHAFDDAAAEARIQKWASSDGSGDKDKINWDKYASVHFWRDPADREDMGGYKLKFCDVVGGRVVAVWRGIATAAAVMQGARGGVNIPEADRAGVQAKIASYYAKARTAFDDATIQVPWASGQKASVPTRAWAHMEIK